MKYKILLVSSGQPSLNPRLVKEADTLSNQGYAVTVLYAYWNAWGTELDKELLSTKKWDAIRIGGDPVEKPNTYFISRLIFKIARLFTQFTGCMLLADIAIARSSFFLMRAAKKHQADLYIGHNLGALPAVVKAAKKHGKPCAFDAEDFHRNEVVDDVNSIAVKLPATVEDKYIPQLQYLTASSPMIHDEYQKLHPRVKTEVLLNAFPKTTTRNEQAVNHSTLKLFWFSQTVGLNRGIENIIEALKLLYSDSFELHLLGDANDAISREFTMEMENTHSSIHFHQPMPSHQIIEFAAQFDIGIAAENDTPLNRDICLTNKLFTYIQAGLPLLASDTMAQKAFIQQYSIAGKVYVNNNAASVADALTYYQQNRKALLQGKAHNYNLGQTTVNWDTESKKLLKLVKQTLPVE